MRIAFRLVLLASWFVALPVLAQGSTTTVSSSAPVAKPLPKASSAFPISGDVRLTSMWGAGTFAPGESQRQALDAIFGYRFAFALPAGFAVSVSELISKNLQTSQGSGAVRDHDTTFGDTFVVTSWAPRISKSDGTSERWTLPGGIRPGFSLTATVPNSRASRYTGRYIGLGPGISFARPDLFGRLSLSYGVQFTKYFQKYTQPYVAAEEFPTLARPSGAEQVGADILVGSPNISYFFRNTLSASFKFDDHWNASLTYILFNRFTAYDAPCDALASPYARCGRGRSDSQWGIATLTYNVDTDGVTSVSATAFTVEPPFSADNRTFRFPFYDFRSTADNYTQVGLELQRTF